MALKRVPMLVSSYSSRQGAGVRLIVLHTAEGATTIESLHNWFANPANQVSSHVGIDDKANTVGEFVYRSQKAWTAAAFNPVAVQAELCGFAKWTASDWDHHQAMLTNCAAWIAEEAKALGIPVTRLTPAQAQGSGRGVCQHVDLGSAGGGHTDCGKAFPFDRVLDMARGGGSSAAPAPPPSSAPPASSSTSAPPFPFPSSHYLGRPDGTSQWHDGHGHGTDSYHVRTWQQKMSSRGWSISVDGVYGAQAEAVCKQFQAEKPECGGVDGKVGPKTWGATWTAPVT